MLQSAEDLTDLGFSFSRVAISGDDLICTEDTPCGAPLFAIPWTKCWTKAAAERCPAVQSALALASQRNPECALLKSDETWITVHLLHEHQSRALDKVFQVRGAGELLKGSSWWQELQQRRQRMERDFLELFEELGAEVCARLGITESGYLMVRSYLAESAVSFEGRSGRGRSRCLLPGAAGLAGRGAGAVEGLRRLRSSVLAVATQSYVKGDVVQLSHRGLCVGSGLRLLQGCAAEAEVLLPLQISDQGLASEIQESLRKDAEDRIPYEPGLVLRETPCHEGVRFVLRELPSARSLQLLGLAVLMDTSKRKDIILEECAWDNITGPSACERRGLRLLLEEMTAMLAAYPASSNSALVAAERKVLEGAIEAARTSQPPNVAAAAPRNVEPLVKVLEDLAQKFQEARHEHVTVRRDGQQWQEELAVILELLTAWGLVDPTSEKAASPVEVPAFRALVAEKLWQQELGEAEELAQLEQLGRLRLRLGEHEQALEDFTRLLEATPGSHEALRLLKLCEMEVSKELEVGFYSLDWAAGEASEPQRKETTEADLDLDLGMATPKCSKAWQVLLDRPLGLRVSELVSGLQVEEVLDGAAKDWNRAMPEAAIRVGDKIVKVNGARGFGRQLLQCLQLPQVQLEVISGDEFLAEVPLVPHEEVEKSNSTWSDVVLHELLGFSPPCLCEWRWYPKPCSAGALEGQWKMATIQLEGCTWTTEVDDVFTKAFACEERHTFKVGMKRLLETLDLIFVPLLLDEEVEHMAELPVEARRFLTELEECDVALRVVALSCGANGPDCRGARDDGYGMAAAAPLRGMFRCFRLEHPEMPILHIDTDALAMPGKTDELEAQIRRELTTRLDAEQVSALTYLGREVAYRKNRRFVPQLDVCPRSMVPCRLPPGLALITGGTGGLGITTAEVLVEHGVRCVVLCSRSGRVSSDAPGRLRERLEALQRKATVLLEACDASEEDQVVAMLQRVRTHGCLRWVVNAAGIVLPHDGAENLKAIFVPKCLGAWHLHRHTMDDDLEAMWFFSSLSGGVGTEGLYNYAAANTYLDELARTRRSMGLVGVSIQFPEVEEAGMAAASGLRGSSATVSLEVVRRALRQLLDVRTSPVVALLPAGYLIARSVYHWLALEPLQARTNKDLWAQLEKTEKENKEELRELRKEVKHRRSIEH